MNQLTQGPGVMLESGVDFARGFSMLDVLTWLGRAKWSLLFFCAVVAVVATGVVSFLPNVYVARTTLIPPGSQQSGGAAAALAALGSLGGAVGLPAAKTPDELYAALLRSESVVRPLIERLDLLKRFDVATYDEARREYSRVVRVSADKKSSVISVEVEDEDPQFAANWANAHVDELGKVLSRLAISEAQQRRVFFEKQLHEANADLLKAEQQLTSVQQSSGLIVADKQAEALIASAAKLRAAIAEKEVGLRVMRIAATDENPEAVRLTSELQGLRAELQRLEGSRSLPGGNPLDLAVGKLPSAAAGYARALRQVKYQEALFQSMLRQYEGARLDEAKEASMAQQIDVAVPPDRKSKPNRGLIVVAATLIASLLGVAVVVARGYSARLVANDPMTVNHWDALRSAWGLRSP